jgi:hypothetical protein
MRGILIILTAGLALMLTISMFAPEGTKKVPVRSQRDSDVAGTMLAAMTAVQAAQRVAGRKNETEPCK